MEENNDLNIENENRVTEKKVKKKWSKKKKAVVIRFQVIIKLIVIINFLFEGITAVYAIINFITPLYFNSSYFGMMVFELSERSNFVGVYLIVFPLLFAIANYFFIKKNGVTIKLLIINLLLQLINPITIYSVFLLFLIITEINSPIG